MDERRARVALRISIHDVHLTTDNEAHDATFRAHRLIRTGGIVPHRKIGRRASRTTDAEADEAEGSRGDEREEEELDVVVHGVHYIRKEVPNQEEKGKNLYHPWPREMSERFVVWRTGAVEKTLPAAQPTTRHETHRTPTNSREIACVVPVNADMIVWSSLFMRAL